MEVHVLWSNVDSSCRHVFILLDEAICLYLVWAPTLHFLLLLVFQFHTCCYPGVLRKVGRAFWALWTRPLVLEWSMSLNLVQLLGLLLRGIFLLSLVILLPIDPGLLVVRRNLLHRGVSHLLLLNLVSLWMKMHVCSWVHVLGLVVYNRFHSLLFLHLTAHQDVILLFEVLLLVLVMLWLSDLLHINITGSIVLVLSLLDRYVIVLSHPLLSLFNLFKSNEKTCVESPV